MFEIFRNNQLQSGFHKRLANSINRKYIITYPKLNKIDDIIRKGLRSHYKKYEKFRAILSAKLLRPMNEIKNIRRQHPCHRDKQCINNAVFFSKIKIITEQRYFRILELRITFVRRFENIRFDHYLTKLKSMLEWKLLAMLDKNPETVHSFVYKRYNHPSFREFFVVFRDDFY